MKKRYLITGGLGFIGQAITQDLVQKKNFVTVIDNNFKNKKFPNLDKKYCKVFLADIRKKASLKKIIKNIDVVIHLAAVNGTNFFYEQPRLVLDVAIKGMINILEICEENKVSEFFLASSSEVYHNPPYFPADEKVPLVIPNPHNPRYSYSAGKIISETMLLNAGFFKRSIIFRPHNVYGPNMGYNHVIPETIMKLIKAKSKLIIQGSGNHTRSFCYIDDFVKAFNVLLKKGVNKNIYNIGTEEEIKIIKLVKKLINISNKKIIITKTKEIAGNPSRRCPDVSKLLKIGFKPSVDLNIGLKKTFDWYKKN